MTLLILIASGVVFFVLGVALIYQGMRNSPDIGEFVAKNDFEEIRGKLELTEKEDEGLKLQLDSMTMALHDARTQAEEADHIRKDVDALRQRDQHYQATIHELEQSLNFISRKADEQAKKAIDAITALNSRNQVLESEIKERLAVGSQQGNIETLKQEKEGLESQLKGNQSRIAELEGQLKGLTQQSQEELQAAQNLIAQLQTQNTRFESGITEITAKISMLEDELSKNRREKEEQLANAQKLIEDLRRQKQQLEDEGTDPKAFAELEGQLNRIRTESENRLTDANQSVARLQGEIDRLQGEIQDNQHQRDDLKRQLEEYQHARAAMDAVVLKDDAQQHEWGEEKRELENELKDLREMNLFLKQKERLLSQELLKSQTQAMGLDRICQEFRKKMEGR
ncbi:MAG TPA: hypothetical protein VLJ10_04955 [Candidatus Bathyarchaeia archaeon]|nr:hypothetical protein [Candidatus Bathyarchaeia archaeon]